VTPGARTTAWVVAALVGVAGIVLAVPVGPGTYGVAQVVSFRALLALGMLVPALVVLAVPAVRRVALPVGLALLLGGLAQAGVLVARSIGTEPFAEVDAPSADGATGTTLTVLAFNTLDAVDAATIAALATAHAADVVVLPETSRTTAEETAALLTTGGRTMQVLSVDGSVPSIAATSLLVDTAVGTYPRADPLATRLGSFTAVPTTAGSPVLVAAHPLAPTRRGAMPTWRTETALVADACRATPGAIVAGDLNATLDHPGLTDLDPCVDAARAVGAAAHGTWPATAPSLLAAPIDHVLVDGRAWAVTGFRVLAATGTSDHRPVVALLARR